MNITGIIDPPVTAYSKPEEIRAWIEELKGMKQTEQVAEAIKDAKTMLKQSERLHNL